MTYPPTQHRKQASVPAGRYRLEPGFRSAFRTQYLSGLATVTGVLNQSPAFARA